MSLNFQIQYVSTRMHLFQSKMAILKRVNQLYGSVQLKSNYTLSADRTTSLLNVCENILDSHAFSRSVCDFNATFSTYTLHTYICIIYMYICVCINVHNVGGSSSSALHSNVCEREPFPSSMLCHADRAAVGMRSDGCWYGGEFRYIECRRSDMVLVLVSFTTIHIIIIHMYMFVIYDWHARALHI